MKISRLQILASILSLVSSATYAQDNTQRKYLIVRDRLPNHMLTELINFPKKTVQLSDFRGKWLILDFWAHGCTSCIERFPGMDSLAQMYKDKNVQVIMVGVLKSTPNNTARLGKNTRDTYSRLNQRYKLSVTTAFDSVLYLKYDLGGLPHIIVVDPNGIIVAKTMHIDSIQIAQLMKGDKPDFVPAYSASEPLANQNYNEKLPLLTMGRAANGGVDTGYVYRSMIVPVNNQMPPKSAVVLNDSLMLRDAIITGKLELFRYSMAELYRLAYFGLHDWPIMDSINYQHNTFNPVGESLQVKSENLKRQYSYSLTVPTNASKDFIQKSLRQDLDRFFRIQSSVEVRKVPVYYLKIKDATKFRQMQKVDGGKFLNSVPLNGVWKIRNTPFWSFMFAVNPGNSTNVPIINSTGLNQMQKISVDYPSDMLDTEEVVEKLNVVGLVLEKGEREMKAIVLR